MSMPNVNLLKSNQSLMAGSTEGKSGSRFDDEFRRIEELIEGNTFSREEINHLVEILDSRVDNQFESLKSSPDTGVDTQLVSGPYGIRITPSIEKHPDIGENAIETSHEKLNVPDGVSASPIDIARAYMAGRSSKGSHDFYNPKPKVERAVSGNEYTRRPPQLPTSPKPSICWPGAVVHEGHGYTTPQSQRSRHRFHDYPRTPYSRITIPKPNTKLQIDNAYANTSSPFEQSRSSIYGKAKSRGDTFDGYGSVGPIRLIKNKFSSEIRPRGSIFSSPKDNPPKMLKPAFGGFLQTTEKTLELGEASGASKYCSGDNASVSSDRDISNPNSSYSDAVRKILEHLDRNKPTPKEKEAELKLVTAWRKSAPEAMDTSQDEKINSEHLEKFASHKNVDTTSTCVSVEFIKNSSKSTLFVNSQDKGVDEAKAAVIETDKSPGSVLTGPSILPGPNSVPSFGLKTAFSTNNHGQTEKNLLFSRPHLSNGQDVKMAASTTDSQFLKNNGKRPSLPSISISKPVLPSVSSENVPGFTFPVSTSSGVLSEPPTPSIMPAALASAVSHSIDLHTIPSYTFGVNKSSPPLVFSFPSTSSTSTQEDSDLKFIFGWEEKTRLSFSSIGKDAICF